MCKANMRLIFILFKKSPKKMLSTFWLTAFFHYELQVKILEK